MQTSLLVAGAGEGLKATIPVLPAAFRELGADGVEPIFVDPVAGKVHAAGRHAAVVGLCATGVVSHAEAAISQGLGGDGPIVVQVDDLAVLGRILAAEEAAWRPVLAYVLVLLPNQTLLGLRLVFVPGVDAASRETTAALACGLGRYQRRAGREAIVGTAGKTAHRLAEPPLRRWFQGHVLANLPKVASGLSAVTMPVEASSDGRRVAGVAVVRHDGPFLEPAALAREFLASSPELVQRGQDVLLAEVTPSGIALVSCRVRATDGQLSIARGVAVEQTGGTSPLRGDRVVVDERHLIVATD